MSTVVIVTGGFDPPHEGHISYLKDAKTLGDILVVGINSNDWLIRKKGFRFMPWETRAEIIRNLRVVDHVFSFNDEDNSACDAIQKMAYRYPLHNIIFANGGDRTKTNIPEMRLKREAWGADYSKRLEFVFGVGGENKQNSSSDILKDFADHIRKNSKNDNSSFSSGPQIDKAPKKLSMESYFGVLEDSPYTGDDGDERDEILYSSKRLYSDIYDYSTWSPGTRKVENR